jgi:hypothetical protein
VVTDHKGGNVEFTDADMQTAMRWQQIQDLAEQAKLPGCPGLVHRDRFTAPGGNVYADIRVVRESVAAMERAFLDQGGFASVDGEAAFDALYQGILN